MNIKDLKRNLDENNVPRNSYSLNGELPMGSGYVLDFVYGKWIVFLFDRGGRYGESEYDNESDACLRIYNALLAYYKPNKAGRFIEKVEAPKEVIYLPDRSKNDI